MLTAGALLALLLAPPAGASLIAPRKACDGQFNRHAPQKRQKRAMRCLVNYARRAAGVRPLRANRALARAAGRKAGDLSRCGFSHYACGRPADLWARRYGYMSGTRSWAFGENLAWGKRKRGTARKALIAWLNSPPHRETLLARRFEHLGVGLRREFGGRERASVWVLQFGCRGC